ECRCKPSRDSRPAMVWARVWLSARRAPRWRMASPQWSMRCFTKALTGSIFIRWLHPLGAPAEDAVGWRVAASDDVDPKGFFDDGLEQIGVEVEAVLLGALPHPVQCAFDHAHNGGISTRVSCKGLTPASSVARAGWTGWHRKPARPAWRCPFAEFTLSETNGLRAGFCRR